MLTVADLAALSVMKFLTMLMRILPDKAAFWLALMVIKTIVVFVPRSLKVGRRNLQIVFPEKSAEEREKILRSSLGVLASNLLSFARIPDAKADALAASGNAEDVVPILERVQKRSKTGSCLFVIGHFGPYEYAFQVLANLYRPSSVLARGFGLPRLDEWCNRRRSTFGNEVFGRKGGFEEVMRRLRAGKDVVLLFDQNVKRNHAIFVDLFGIKAAVTKTMGIVSIRTEVPIIFASCIKEDGGRYRFVVKEIPGASECPGSTLDKIAFVTRSLNEALEESVRANPDHWFWLHRRFKTRPPGEPENVYL